MSSRKVRILILSHVFPPSTAIGARRVLFLVRALVERDCEVTVVTSSAPSGEDFGFRRVVVGDPLEQWIRGKRRDRTSPEFDGAHSYQQQFLGFMSRYTYWVRHSLVPRMIILDRQSFWSHRVQKLVHHRFRVNPPDLVLASVPPISTLLAASQISKSTGAHLSLDFRDLWKPSVMKKSFVDRAWLYVAERLINEWIKRTEFTTGVSGEIVSALESHFRVPATLVANGVEPDEWQNVSPMEFGRGSHIVYTGKIYPEYLHRFRRFVTTLASIVDDYDVWFHYFGPDSRVFLDAFHREGIGPRIKCYGEVERSLTHQAQRAADILLLMAGDSGYQVNTKVYDYLAAGPPILTLGPQKGELADLVQHFGEELPVETQSEIREGLANLLEQARGPDRVAVQSRIEQMSRQRMSRYWVNQLLASVSR